METSTYRRLGDDSAICASSSSVMSGQTLTVKEDSVFWVAAMARSTWTSTPLTLRRCSSVRCVRWSSTQSEAGLAWSKTRGSKKNRVRTTGWENNPTQKIAEADLRKL